MPSDPAAYVRSYARVVRYGAADVAHLADGYFGTPKADRDDTHRLALADAMEEEGRSAEAAHLRDLGREVHWMGGRVWGALPEEELYPFVHGRRVASNADNFYLRNERNLANAEALRDRLSDNHDPRAMLATGSVNYLTPDEDGSLKTGVRTLHEQIGAGDLGIPVHAGSLRRGEDYVSYQDEIPLHGGGSLELHRYRFPTGHFGVGYTWHHPDGKGGDPGSFFGYLPEHTAKTWLPMMVPAEHHGRLHRFFAGHEDA